MQFFPESTKKRMEKSISLLIIILKKKLQLFGSEIFVFFSGEKDEVCPLRPGILRVPFGTDVYAYVSARTRIKEQRKTKADQRKENLEEKTMHEKREF